MKGTEDLDREWFIDCIPGEALEELLGDEGHEGRNEPEARVKTDVENVPGSQDGGAVTALGIDFHQIINI